MRRIAWVLSLVTACADSPATVDGPPPIVGGSRLHARWQTAGDARRFVGWHDSVLGQDCTFSDYVHNHDHRCLPRAVRSGAYFADPACTQPLANSFTDNDPPAIVLDPAPDACVAEPTIHAVGAPVTGQIYDAFSGTCMPTGADHVYEIGASLDPAMFVGAVETPDGDQLWLVADDGVRTPWGGWDGRFAVQPSKVVGGGVRWAPWMVAYTSNAFADAACTVPVATKIAESARCPLDAALEFPEPGFPDGVVFHTIHNAVDTVFQLDTTCTGHAVAPDTVAVVVGDPIPVNEMVRAGDIVIGDGPVRVHYATFDNLAIASTSTDGQLGGNQPPGPDVFIDAFTTEPCDAATASDGVVRCMPLATTSVLLFLDAGCTQPIMPAADAGHVFAYTGSDAAVHVRPVRAPVASVPAQLYYETDLTTCSPTMPDPASYMYLGDEIAADQFATMGFETDD